MSISAVIIITEWKLNMRELLGNQRLKCACSVIQLIRLHAKVMKKASSLRPHLNIDWESPKDDHKIDNLRRRN